ncbi:PACE efflux transporter [Pseudooceanicola sp. MF1-13]|uniref:PACE efflux transporter n=1 Tax=Pseudooceanicola sp. MF1-13 TaxID=3379095 RepID=UPI0038917EE6
MRSTFDRIRHALLFELIGLMLIVPIGSLLFGLPFHHIGVVALFTSLLATGWTYLYNLGFDRLLIRRRGHARKGVGLRVLHSLLFELGLLVVTLPFIAAYLGIGLWQALIMDAAIVVFYLVYSFAYNWAYDALFPLPDQASSSASQYR